MKKSTVLRPTKQTRRKKKIYGLDIETYNDNKKFLMCSIYYDDNNKWTFTKKEDVLTFLKTKRFKNSYVVATNLGFDFFGLFHNTEELQQFNLLFRGSSLLTAETFINHKQFHRKSQDNISKKIGEKITFIDTGNYCMMGVEKLGNIIGIGKLNKPAFLGQKPKTKEEWKIMTEYNMQDSKISKIYLQFLYDSLYELGSTPKLTIAGSSMSLFTNKYLKEKYYRQPVHELKELFQGYYGGRTEVFNRGKIEDHYYYDFNSLYPSVMRNAYPNPNSKKITYKNTLKYIKEYEGMSQVTIYCPKDLKIPLLPYRNDKKLLFPTGVFKGWYTHIEINQAIQEGYKILYVHKTYYYTQTCRPFRDYVEDLYTLRLKYKKSNNPMQQVVKLLMNSLYGKFGQKFTNRDNWLPATNMTYKEVTSYSNVELFENGKYARVVQKETQPANFCIPIWAAYVTAYGRLKLHNLLKQTNPIYCDTDSIITRKELVCTTDLGDLKMEMKIKKGYIIKPKFYALLDSNNQEYVKIKGISKHLSMIDLNHLIEKPEITYVKFTKLKEAIRRGLIPNELQLVTKKLNLNDDKRTWHGRLNLNKTIESTPKHIIDASILHIPEYKYLNTFPTEQQQKSLKQQAIS